MFYGKRGRQVEVCAPSEHVSRRFVGWMTTVMLTVKHLAFLGDPLEYFLSASVAGRYVGAVLIVPALERSEIGDVSTPHLASQGPKFVSGVSQTVTLLDDPYVESTGL